MFIYLYINYLNFSSHPYEFSYDKKDFNNQYPISLYQNQIWIYIYSMISTPILLLGNHVLYSPRGGSFSPRPRTQLHRKYSTDFAWFASVYTAGKLSNFPFHQ